MHNCNDYTPKLTERKARKKIRLIIENYLKKALNLLDFTTVYKFKWMVGNSSWKMLSEWSPVFLNNCNNKTKLLFLHLHMQASFFNIKFSLIQKKKNGGKPLAYIFTQTQKKKSLLQMFWAQLPSVSSSFIYCKL